MSVALKKAPELDFLYHEKKRRRAMNSINAFTEYCMRDSRTGFPFKQASLHRTLQAFIDKNLFPVIIIPREHGKVLYGRVLMASGELKHCTKLKVGDEVVSFDEKTLKTSTSRVKHIENHKIPTVCVKLKSGRECVCGDFHQFFTPSGWKEVKFLSFGDYVAVPRSLPYFGNKEIGNDVAKTLGLLVAEGGSTSNFVTFTNRDEEVVEELRKRSGFIVKLQKNNPGNFNLQPRGKVVSFLKRFGLLGKYSKEKFVPDEIFTAPKEEVLAFLAGYIQGDGSFYFVRNAFRFEVGSASHRLIKDVAHLLLRFSLRPIVYFKVMHRKGKKFPFWTIYLHGFQAKSLAELLLPFLVGKRLSQVKKASKVTIGEHSSHDTLPKEIWKRLQLPQKWYAHTGRSFSYYNPGREKLQRMAREIKDQETAKLAESNIFWDRIKSVEKEDSKEVPFIQFGEIPTFVGEDIYHHNTAQVISRILFALGKNHNELIKMVCASDTVARKRVMEVRENIARNAELHEIFPDLLEDKNVQSWSKHAITVERDIMYREPSLEASGILSTGVGGRTTFLVFDDPVDLRNAILNPAQRQSVKDAFYEVWMNLLDEPIGDAPPSRMIYIATPWHEDDLTHELKKNPSYKTLELSIDEKFTPLWPEKWPKERLIQKLGQINRRAFDRNFRNIALTEEELMFNKNALYLCKDVTASPYDKKYDKMDKYAGVDLGISEKAGTAYTVIFVIGVDEGGVKHVLSIRRKRMSSPATARAIKDTNEAWHPKIFMVENNAYQDALIQWMEEIGYAGLPIMPFTTGKNKADPNTGLPSLAVEFERLGWNIPMSGSDHEEGCQCTICIWLSEMCSYPIGKYTDTVMGCWFAREAARSEQKSFKPGVERW